MGLRWLVKLSWFLNASCRAHFGVCRKNENLGGRGPRGEDPPDCYSGECSANDANQHNRQSKGDKRSQQLRDITASHRKVQSLISIIMLERYHFFRQKQSIVIPAQRGCWDFSNSSSDFLWPWLREPRLGSCTHQSRSNCLNRWSIVNASWPPEGTFVPWRRCDMMQEDRIKSQLVEFGDVIVIRARIGRQKCETRFRE
jgi:hypothetical protein